MAVQLVGGREYLCFIEFLLRKIGKANHMGNLNHEAAITLCTRSFVWDLF